MFFVVVHALVSVSLTEAAKLSWATEAPTVKVEQGTLKGVVSQTADNTTFYRFHHIPFAKPPLGQLRFAAPQEPSSWTGVRDATKTSRDCQQFPPSGASSEDCLYLSVFTPQLPSGGKKDSLLPVMVHIHGGAFVTGSANAWPGQLMNYGVVFVNFGYRLNLFGFMAIEGTDAVGNAGLKDQVAALKWIQKNIAQFGGDPKNITIMGESAGGASVHYHILSPMSKGLFHKAISESGSALASFAYVQQSNTQRSAFQLSSLVGRPANTTTQLIANLRAASSTELILALANVTILRGSERPFAPCVEYQRHGEESFLVQPPWSLVRKGSFTSVPYIAGSTKFEAAQSYTASVMSAASFWEGVNANLESYLVPYDLGLTPGSVESKKVEQEVLKFYFGGEAPSYKTRAQWVNLNTDIHYAFGVVATVHAHAKYSTSRTYNYQLTFGGATHAMEWRYIIYGGKVKGETSRPAKFAGTIGQLWTSFAKTGVPTEPGAVTWAPVKATSFPYLELNTPTAISSDVDKDRMNFWFDIYDKYRNTSATLL